MKKLFLIISIFSISQSLLGQSAIYQDNVLSIPQRAVVDTDNPAYYEEIQLINDGDGKFRMVAATSRNLVTVDSVDVLILESFPVQVMVAVSGNKSVPCVELETPAVSRKDAVFTIVLTESQLGPAETCIAIISPFEITISLNVLGLAEGTYMVKVNGIEAEFTLAMDNKLL